jgi:hypothetical protein
MRTSSSGNCQPEKKGCAGVVASVFWQLALRASLFPGVGYRTYARVAAITKRPRGVCSVQITLLNLLPLALILIADPAAPKAAEPGFPDSWVGHWAGDATLNTPKGVSMRFTMELKIAKTDDPAKYEWTIIYDDGKNRQERPYQLVVKDAAKGSFEIDEKNGIVLPATLIGGSLYSAFDLEGVRLVSRDQLVGDAIETEIITMSTKQLVATGGKADDPEAQAPPVTGVPVVSVQRATLKKK